MGKTSATWADIGAFLKADRWTPGRKTDHQFFTKLLPDGTTLETSISNSGRKTLTPGRFSDILRTQLRVSRDDFWEAIRAGNPAARPSVVEVPPPQHLSWVVRVLSNELHMSAEEIGKLSVEEAIEVVGDYRSRPRE